jgi:membrane protease YdiL (CAAX protease family)
MSEPQRPASIPPEKPLGDPAANTAQQILGPPPREEIGWAPNLFVNENARAVWKVLGYFAFVTVTVYWLMWLGVSLFREPVHGPALLWREMYQEFAMAMGAVLPAIVMGRFEGRSLGDYALPVRQAFGKLFWEGALWGLAAITLLLVALRISHAFYFGQVVLHGIRVLRFAAFWAVFFVLVGIFEEAVVRGYALFTLARAWGFWPAAVVLSLVFGAIHFRNPGETWVGLLGVVAIGMFFCLTLYRTGSLWFAVGFHAFWDWGQTFLYSVPDSGTVEPGHLMRPVFHGNDWLTGGSVGPEASVVCFLVIAVVGAAFVRRYRVTSWAVVQRRSEGKSF